VQTSYWGMRDGGGGEVKTRGQWGGEPTTVGEARERAAASDDADITVGNGRGKLHG
jgi:hypothetical protein